MVENEKPSEFIKIGDKLENVLQKRIGNITRGKYDKDWLLNKIKMENLILVFIGPAGIGKTNFALSHFKNPLHVTIRQDFRKLGPHSN